MSAADELVWAARADDIDEVRRLLASGCSPDVEPGQTAALHVAAARGQPAIARLLLEHGAAIEARDLGPFGALTALHLAAIYGHVEVAELLLEHGADPRAATSEASEDWAGYTPLHFAAEQGQVDVLAALLRRDPHAIATTTGKGKRPWDLAEDRLVRALLLTVGRGASVDEFERARGRARAGFYVRAIAPEALPSVEPPELLRRLARPQDHLHPSATGMWLWLRPKGGAFEVALADAARVVELRERVLVREPIVAVSLDGRRLMLACRERGIVMIDPSEGSTRVVLSRERLPESTRALGLFGEGAGEAVIVHAGERLEAWPLHEQVDAPWWSYATTSIRAVFMPAGPLVVLTPRASLTRALWCVADPAGLRPHSRFEPRVTEVWATRELDASGSAKLRWFAHSGRSEAQVWELHGVASLRSDAAVLDELPDSDGMRAFSE